VLLLCSVAVSVVAGGFGFILDDDVIIMSSSIHGMARGPVSCSRFLFFRIPANRVLLRGNQKENNIMYGKYKFKV